MISKLRSPLTWMLANAAGVGLFLLTASIVIWEPESAYGPSGAAPFIWVITVVPILLFFVMADVVWLVISLKEGPLRHRFVSIVMTAIILTCWVGAYLIDNAHHGG